MKTTWNLILDKKSWSLEFLWFMPKISTGDYDRRSYHISRSTVSRSLLTNEWPCSFFPSLEVQWTKAVSTKLTERTYCHCSCHRSNFHLDWNQILKLHEQKKACVRWEVWLHASLCVYLYARLEKYAWTGMILYALHAMLERNLVWNLRPRVLWGGKAWRDTSPGHARLAAFVTLYPNWETLHSNWRNGDPYTFYRVSPELNVR